MNRVPPSPPHQPHRPKPAGCARRVRCALLVVVFAAATSCSDQADGPPVETARSAASVGEPASAQTPAAPSSPPAKAAEATSEAAREPPADSPVELARVFIRLLVDEDFAAAVARFDEGMARVLPADKLAEVWRGLVAQAGPLKEQLSARSEKNGALDAVLVTCRFAKMKIDVKVVLNADRQVTGLWFTPAETPEYQAPAYVRRDAFREEPVRFGENPWSLPGTLAVPAGEGPFPAVVLVHGSGPNDRDETIGPNKPFRDLAWGLASQGIAVLRYDKRTKVHGLAMAGRPLTVWEETIQDALAAAELLRGRDRVDRARIFIFGHSLGAMLAPRMAEFDPNVAGFIVAAGITRPLEDVMLAQAQYLFGLDGQISADEQAKLDELRTQIARVKDPGLAEDAPQESLPGGVPASYWLDLRGYHPDQAAAKIDRPLLILQGERDYQVTMEDDFQGWQAALSGRPNVRLRSYPKLNHLFIAGEGPCTPAEYAAPGHVAEAVVADVAAWIREH